MTKCKSPAQFTLKQIGTIRASEGSFSLHLDEAYIPALKELDGFAYVNVLWWAHHVDSDEARGVTVCDRPYKTAPEKMGIFATRSPVRPNPIALTPVAVLHIDHEKGVIQVPFMDAEDGTPLLDIKPYHPAVDRIREAAVPSWCEHWPKYYEDSATFDWAGEFENAR